MAESKEHHLQELAESECKRLLSTSSVGRIGLVIDGQPMILPVNYVFDNDLVVMRVESGSTVSQAAMTSVAFEIDVIDSASHRGWSVLVLGRARDVTTSIDERSEQLRELCVSPWAAGEKATWIAVAPHRITGRRLG